MLREAGREAESLQGGEEGPSSRGMTWSGRWHFASLCLIFPLYKKEMTTAPTLLFLLPSLPFNSFPQLLNKHLLGADRTRPRTKAKCDSVSASPCGPQGWGDDRPRVWNGLFPSQGFCCHL